MTVIEKVIIIGAGGHGSELYSYIKDLTKCGKKVSLIGFIDEQKLKGANNDLKILGDFGDLGEFLQNYRKSNFFYITATGDNQLRQRFVKKIEQLNVGNLLPWTVRHPSALVGDKVEIGEGSCLAPRSIITTRTKIGRHCILNVNASVSHDCVVGDFVNINPAAVVCGNVKIGNGCYIGAQATIINKISIGEGAVIGAGAVVTDDIPKNVTAVGVPAKVIKKND